MADETVLELGAGAGLPGILATLEGAELVVLSDYDSPSLLANLMSNVEANIPKAMWRKVKVQGYIWGHDSAVITQYIQHASHSTDYRYRPTFSRILVADCFWISDQHGPLVATLSQLLDRSASARVYVVAGFHTGRSTLANFFYLAELHGLVPDEDKIEEKNIINNSTRPWADDRGIEDTMEQKKWLVIAKLKWA